MHRIRKLLWMIFIFCVVFFIICDEKWYKIWFKNNQIIFEKVEGKSDLLTEAETENVVYKNSDIIHLNYDFKEPKNLRSSNWMDPQYLAKLEQERKEIEEQRKRQVYTWPSIISVDDKNSISSFFHSEESQEETGIIQEIWNKTNDTWYEGWDIKTWTVETWYNLQPEIVELTGDISTWVNIEWMPEDLNSIWVLEDKSTESISISTWDNEESTKMIATSLLEKFELKKLSLNLWSLTKIEETAIETWTIEVVKYIPTVHKISLNKWIEKVELTKINKYAPLKHSFTLKKWIELPKVHIQRYQFTGTHPLNLKKWVLIHHKFVVNDDNEPQTWNAISDDVLNSLLENEEIDVNTLESENDEFLQRIFQETKDIDVMNLIVETYLDEYQFVKAKRFIESLSQTYLTNLKPSLNLRVVFNSFSLISKTISETLTMTIQNYLSKNQISTEDWNWYLWVIALMERNYDRFFEIATNFTSEEHKSFASKIQWYKDQISKQMWMPEYYFDTLVSLELFNQWFFQPAKVLALYSLQQNSDYILPYQILAYANFLTNSRDTSIEYLKKLVDLDPNNSQKYQFLMGVAYYWNEKYEQSVIMLSMVQNEKLRLDADRYLIRDYLHLDQKNKLISSRNKMLWYENLVASDFYTYFYEVFYRPYSEWTQYQLYAIDAELADKMIRICAIRLPNEEKAVCNYGSIWKNIALWRFEWLEQSLLNLATQYPQWYLYHALGEYYLHQEDLEKAKVYLLKAVSLTQNRWERSQIKKLLQDAM